MKTRAPILLAPLLLALVGLAPPAWAQTNPCTTEKPTGITINPSKTYLISTDHETGIAGSTTEKLVTGYEARVFEQSKNPAVDPPFTTVSTLRSAWTLVAGTTDCYVSTAPYPLSPGIVFKEVVIAKANPLANTTDSLPSEVSNFFAQQGRPRVGANRVAP